MPANKNAIIRYMLLDKFLSSSHYYDIHDLTHKVNDYLELNESYTVSQRTIEKDLVAMEMLLPNINIDIVHKSINGKRCIFYADKNNTIFTKKLTDEERGLLSEVLHTIGQFDGLENFEWFDGLKKSLGVDDNSRKIIDFSNNEYLASLNDPNLLGKLFSAISNNQVIKVVYKPFNKPPFERFVHPYLLKEYNNRWFLICADDSDLFTLNLALDRFVSVEVHPELIFKDCVFDIEDRFYNIVGVTLNQNKPIEHIIFWVADKECDYVRTNPLHATQKEVKDVNLLREKYTNFKGGSFFSIDCIINEELLKLLSSLLDGVVVLSPMALRENISERINNALLNYDIART